MNTTLARIQPTVPRIKLTFKSAASRSIHPTRPSNKPVTIVVGRSKSASQSSMDERADSPLETKSLIVVLKVSKPFRAKSKPGSGSSSSSSISSSNEDQDDTIIACSPAADTGSDADFFEGDDDDDDSSLSSTHSPTRSSSPTTSSSYAATATTTQTEEEIFAAISAGQTISRALSSRRPALKRGAYSTSDSRPTKAAKRRLVTRDVWHDGVPFATPLREETYYEYKMRQPEVQAYLAAERAKPSVSRGARVRFSGGYHWDRDLVHAVERNASWTDELLESEDWRSARKKMLKQGPIASYMSE